MFREMRRKERQISNMDSMEIINNGEFGILSTIGPNGYPYGTPLNYVCHNDCIYFHSAAEGHKIDNVENNNKVSFCIVSDAELLPERFGTKYRSVIVFGKASEAIDPEKEDALTALIKKYSGQFLEKGKKYILSSKDKTRVFKIEIEHVAGKSNRRI
jgi:nitroimidazol reductase NimA-like FMN-containing flavoprotein (pyridoxamine 5'-phosphate oxidase superfamily)